MLGLFNKFKKGLQKTSKRFFGVVGSIFGNKRLDESTLESLEEALYEADFGVETTTEVMEAIQEAYKKDETLHGKGAREIATAVLKKTLQGSEPFENWVTGDPEVICLLGVNGAGKTTTAGKLGYLFKQDGLNVALGACDTFRAAANEQINVWANRVNLDIISSQHGADAAAVAFDAYVAAKNRGHKVLVLDTAGRLHTKSHLMDELTKIKKVLQKHDEKAPHQCWLVVDGSMGSNSIDQARAFHKKFGLNGLVITKLDGTSRGGALLGIYRELKIPIYFVGLGEQPEDLQPFSIDNYVNALFDLEDE